MQLIQFRETGEVIAKARQIADEKGMSLSTICRWALRDFCYKHTRHVLKPGEDLNDDRHQH